MEEWNQNQENVVISTLNKMVAHSSAVAKLNALNIRSQTLLYNVHRCFWCRIFAWGQGVSLVLCFKHAPTHTHKDNEGPWIGWRVIVSVIMFNQKPHNSFKYLVKIFANIIKPFLLKYILQLLLKRKKKNNFKFLTFSILLFSCQVFSG